MKVVKLKGGLGNQMFQYAFALGMQMYTGEIVKLDLQTYYANTRDEIRRPRIKKFNISLDEVNRDELKHITWLDHSGDALKNANKVKALIEHIFNSKYLLKKRGVYTPYNELSNYLYFDGYWQSYKYVYNIEERLRQEFTSREKLSERTQNLIDSISKQNGVFVGVRRGDYITNKRASRTYTTFDMNYYTHAMDYIMDRVEDPIFYVFSNEIEWVKKNMDFSKYNIIYHDDEITDDFEDLILMSACKHAVTVNSTYYWWGAWLINNRNKIIIAPQKWFANNRVDDIVPDDWVKM